MCVLQRITCFSWSVNFCCWNQAWMLQTFLNSTNFSIVPGLRYYYYYTHLMASFPAQHGQAGIEKVKPVWFKWGKRWWFFGYSGISWAMCKQSAPRCRQITTPTPHHSIFTGRVLFLMPNQQCQSTEDSARLEVILSYVRYYSEIQSFIS